MTVVLLRDSRLVFSRNVVNKEWNKKISIEVRFDLDDVEGWEGMVGIDTSKIQGRTYIILVAFEPLSVVVSGHSFIRYFSYSLSILSSYERSSSRVVFVASTRSAVCFSHSCRSILPPPPFIYLITRY